MKTLLSLSALICSGVLAAAPQESVSLTPILMYVADHAGAEAAAPRIQRIIEREGVAQLKVEPYDLLLLRATSCFGSKALQQVMHPFITPPSEEELTAVEPFLSTFNQMWQAIDDLASLLEGVHDKTSADAAAEQLFSFAPFMSSSAEKFASLQFPGTDSVRRELRLRYLSGTRKHTSRLLQAWGRLALRDADYYNSEQLVEGLLAVRDVLENMDMQVDPTAIPAVMQVTEQALPLMQQWVAVVSQVQDRASADVAARQLQRIREKMHAIARQSGLSRSYEEDIFLFSPELEVLVHIMDRISHYLEDEVSPPCFGSASLREALQHED